tara:strand:- start:842 stop:1045 length:204 start_codon:yes stop_codon:yes gene_type:complete
MTSKLWQTLEKEHLDLDNKLSDKEWENFVEENEDAFAEFTAEYGNSLFINYLYKMESEDDNDEVYWC